VNGGRGSSYSGRDRGPGGPGGPSGRDERSPWPRALTLTLAVLLSAAAVSVPAVASSPPRNQSSSGTVVALTVNVSGEGLVTYSDGSPPCTDLGCVTNEPSDSVVFLTATPAQGYQFIGWTRGCVGTGSICGITPAQAPVISALFAHAGMLEVTVAGPGKVGGAGLSCGSGADQCSAQLSGTGSTVLDATPAPGAAFLGWGGACAQFATGPCTIDDSAFSGATATFASTTLTSTPQPFDVTHTGPVASAPGSLDACLAQTPCETSLAGESSVSLTAGGSFINSPFTPLPSVTWSGSCVGSWPVCTLVVDRPIGIDVLSDEPVTRAVGSSESEVLIKVTVVGRGLLQAVRGTLTPKGCGSRAVGSRYMCTLVEPRSGFELRARPVGDKFRAWGSDFGTICTPAVSTRCANRVTYDGPALAAVFSG
jgi:hypothetical protein